MFSQAGKRIIVTTIIMMLSACVPVATSTLSPSVPIATPATVTPLPTKPQPTSTPVNTLLPQTEIFQYLMKRTHTQCASFIDANTTQTNFSGILGLSRIDTYNNSFIGLLNLDTGENRSLLGESEMSSYYAAVSPDGTKLAFNKWNTNDSTQSWLVLSYIDGAPDVLIPWQEEWSHIVRWLDNDKLLILNHGSSLTMSIYDPATGAQNRVSGEISSSFIPSVSWREAPVIFSPDLTRILVPDGESILKLFDAETKKEIAVFEPVLNEHVPVWLPDASGFIFSNYIWVPDTTMGFRPIGDTLVFVSRDGDAKNIVELLDSPSAMVIDSYSWSPNSQLIAFWTMDVVDSFGYLTILDAITGEISNTCIESKFLRANDVVPVWSSDGNQVAFQIFEGTSFQSGKLVIYDLNKNVAIKFDENLRPIGWMNNEP